MITNVQMASKRAKSLLDEAKRILDAHADSEMPAAVRKQYDAITAEAEAINKEIRDQRDFEEGMARAARLKVDGASRNHWVEATARKIEAARGESRALNSGDIDTYAPVERIANIAEPGVGVYNLFDVKQAADDANGTSYLRQVTRTDNSEFVADSGQKPTSVYTLVEVNDRLRVLAHLSEPIPKRYIDDSEAIRRFLESEMQAGLLSRLDEAILLGDDAAAGTDEFDGLIKLAGAASAFATDVVTSTANALTAQLDLGHAPDFWVFKSSDWQSLSLTREQTNGQYLFGKPADGAGRMLHGIPVVLSPNMNAGFALLGQRDQADLLVKGAEIAWNGQDAALFDYNLMKVRVEIRVVLRVYRPAAFKYVDIVTP